MTTLVRRAALAPVVLYRRMVSPSISCRCKYEPSCSSYASNAVQTYGVLRGSLLALWRLIRCNPFSRGGYDPVSAQRIFR